MKKTKNIFWGLILILSAIIIVINELNIFSLRIDLIDLLLTILMVYIIIKSLMNLSFFGICLPVAILSIIYSSELGIEALTPWVIILVAVLLSIGLNFIFGGLKKNRHHHENFIEEEINSESNEINISTTFGATTKYINSKNVEKIDLDCKFGACKLYLDKSQLKDNKAVIDLDLSFAGIELYIPKEWKVINNVSCNLGGIDEKNKSIASSDTTLILEGKCSFAGIEIIYI